MAEAFRTRVRPGSLLVRLVMLVALSFAVTARPAVAQSVLRDAETETLLRDISAPLIEAAGLRPADVRIVLIHDQSINAFVAGGQIVYLHSGLITSAANANEVQGVIAHELGHIVGGHIISSGDGIRNATRISLLSLLVGAVAIAAGAGDAGAAAMSMGQRAAIGSYLAFNRTQESSADQAGASYMRRAGISGRGSLAFFQRLENLEFRLNIPQEDSYERTHPLNRERLAALENLYRTDAAWERPTDAALEDRFQRVRAKLVGFVEHPSRVFQRYPDRDRSIPARYARAYAYHKSALRERALAEVDTLLAERPGDPYFLELRGQILLETGQPREALASLREAVARAPAEPLIAAMLGHALISTEDPGMFDEAKQVLRAAIGRDNTNPFAWYQLGIVYDREGDQARASLATAERYNLIGEPRLALANAEQAMLGIPVGTPDWLRAQDIAMVSRSEVERERRER